MKWLISLILLLGLTILIAINGNQRLYQNESIGTKGLKKVFVGRTLINEKTFAGHNLWENTIYFIDFKHISTILYLSD